MEISGECNIELSFASKVSMIAHQRNDFEWLAPASDKTILIRLRKTTEKVSVLIRKISVEEHEDKQLIQNTCLSLRSLVFYATGQAWQEKTTCLLFHRFLTHDGNYLQIY